MDLIRLETGNLQARDGTPLFYEIHGEGDRSLVFVYGLACLMNHWHFQIEAFSRLHSVVCFDLRGHHKSGLPEDPRNLSFQNCVEDLVDLCRFLAARGQKRITLVGHSLGVPLVLAASMEAPELADSMVLVNGFARNPLRGTLGKALVQTPLLSARELYRLQPEWAQKLWNEVVRSPLSASFSGWMGGFNLKLTDIHDIEIYLKGVSQVPLSVFFPLFEELLQVDLLSQLREIETPCLIVGGDSDHLTPREVQEELHRNLKNSELLMIPYGSHCTQLDFPDFLNLKILDFLSRIGSEKQARDLAQKR